uniref:Uncharacterized protein n=1 Tax=Anguilla anguilla TaxID=7936 RepID=A0A0E9X9Y4_ANGAN
MLKMRAKEVREEGSWYCSMFLCFSFSVLPGSSTSMNFITGSSSGLGPATRRMMVYPSPNLFFKCCTLPRQRNRPFTMMAILVHRASHSSMLCEVRTTERRSLYDTVDTVPQSPASFGVHASGGLVQEHHRWASNESHGSGEFAHVPTAVAPSRLIHVLHQAQLADPPLCNLTDLLVGHTAQDGVELQVLAAGQEVIDGVKLGAVAHVLVHLINLRQDALSSQIGLSSRDSRVSRQHLEGARLSSPIHTKQAEALSWRDAHTEAVHGRHGFTLVHLSELSDLQDVRVASSAQDPLPLFGYVLILLTKWQ